MKQYTLPKLRLQLRRVETGDQGTFGLLSSSSHPICFITELPWRDNVKQKSCIPEGFYSCVWARSPRFGMCYHVTNVPGRGDILIHSGNFAGDTSKNWISNSHGCLLPSKKLGRIAGQRAGLMSVPALQALIAFTQKQPFILEIANAYCAGNSSK